MPGYLVNLFAPHYCCSCGAVGAVLCEYCKYNIVSEPYTECILCHNIAKPTENLCGTCKSSFTHAWVVGSRTGPLKKVIDDYKFERMRAAHKVLGEIFVATLPSLPKDIEIVPIPTIAKHVRIRGYDHMHLIARQLARSCGLPYSRRLRRNTTTTQRGADRAVRQRQAATAFTACNVRKGARYLLIDDISTTGATLEHAARALRGAGASEVWVAVLATQPLENRSDIW
jgi:ComF family protein